MAETNDNYDPEAQVRRISASLDQPDKFAEIFCSAAKTQKNIDAVLTDVIKNLLRSDNEARETIKGLLREVENEDWRSFLKKGGALAIPIGTLIIGAFLNHYLNAPK